jgi:hypothetical protein
MSSSNLLSPSSRTTVGAIVSSTAFFTFVCFALAMALLMAQPPQEAVEQETPERSGVAVETDLAALQETSAEPADD